MENNPLFWRMDGQAEAAQAVAASIPLQFIQNPNTTFADLAMGGGQYLKAVLDRCLEYHELDQILPRLYGWESSRMFTNYAIIKNKLKGANIAVGDPFNLNKKFDVIIGNPPYQRPKHAEGNKDNRPLWLEFLSKSGEYLANGGYMSLLVPGQVVKTTRWSQCGKGLKALQWGNVTSIKTGVEKLFNVGTSIFQVTATTGPQSEKTLVNGDIEVNLKKRPWLPTVVTNESLSLVDKISSQANNFNFKLCPELESIENQSVMMYRMNQDYGYSVEITSERRKTKANGEPLKLMWLNMDCETRAQAENIKRLMRSKLFTALRRLTFYEPNYAHLFINGMTYPDQIPATDEEIYKAYSLTESEISFVESFQN